MTIFLFGLSIVIAFIFAEFVADINNDYFSFKAFITVIIPMFSFSTWYGDGKDFCVVNTPQCLASVAAKDKAEADSQSREDEFCRHSSPVSTQDGVTLYRTNCRVNGGEFVYFSKSGTTTRHEVCHGAKPRHCENVTDTTSNAE